jgi:hypothetical protein
MLTMLFRSGADDSLVMPEGFTTQGSRRYHFSLPGVYCDLEKGEIVLQPIKDGTDDHPVQNVALSFVASLLYLMVQPRPKEVQDEKIKVAAFGSLKAPR